jgi:hypothetical protein
VDSGAGPSGSREREVGDAWLHARGDPDYSPDDTGELVDGDIIKYQVGMEGSIGWREQPTDDHDRAQQILMLAMAFHLERDGQFGMYDKDGRYWIVRTKEIAAVSITDPEGRARRAPLGFARLE